MVIVAGWIDVDASQRDHYLVARREAMLASRDEPGCIDYVLSLDPIHPGRVRLFECWRTREDLDEHLKVFRSRPPAQSFRVNAREVNIYEVKDKEHLD
jgi:quinol monooxygenase YgiN